MKERQPTRSVTFHPVLRCKLVNCSQVAVRIRGLGLPRGTLRVFINGQATVLYPRRTGCGYREYVASSFQFEPWENIVSFSPGDGLRVTDIVLFPLCPKLGVTYGECPGEVWGRCAPLATYDGLDVGVLLEDAASALRVDSPTIGAGLSRIAKFYNREPRSAYRGTFYPAYDVDNSTFRLVTWVWCTAVVVKLLVDIFKWRKEIVYLRGAESLCNVLLRFQEVDGPNRGGFRVRTDSLPESPCGLVTWIAPNDSAFIGGYALVPLYKVTGNNLYLERALALKDWVLKQGTEPSGLVYVGYKDELRSWEKDWIYVDAGFTPVLYASLADIIDRSELERSAHKFIDAFVDRLWCTRGYFLKTWRRSGVDRRVFTRGQAWALDGLISSSEAFGRSSDLDFATRCATFLLSYQHEDGGWSYLADDARSGPCNKAPAILAYHFLRLYKLTADRTFYDAAERALGWCDNHRITVSNGSTCLTGAWARNEEGCIGVRRVGSIFMYAEAYYVLARLLQISLAGG